MGLQSRGGEFPDLFVGFPPGNGGETELLAQLFLGHPPTIIPDRARPAQHFEGDASLDPRLLRDVGQDVFQVARGPLEEAFFGLVDF